MFHFKAIILRVTVLCLLLCVAFVVLPAVAQSDPVATPEIAPAGGEPPVSSPGSNSFQVSYGGRTYDAAANRTTFTYIVTGGGTPPDLSHFDVEIPRCPIPLDVAAYAPTDAVSFGVDPTTGVDGIKWDLPLGMNASRTYTITFVGDVPEGTVTAAVKAGGGFTTFSLPGASCSQARVDVEKFISVDGVSWQDADSVTGPVVPLTGTVAFRFVVTNTGTVPLSNLTLVDNVYPLTACTLPSTLTPGAFFDCVVSGQPVQPGQHTNVATATGMYNAQIVTDSDSANYFGGDLPAVDVEKYVSSDGATWADVDNAPGPQLLVDSEVWFRFVITNTGTAPLTNITLADNVLALSGWGQAATLSPGQSIECVIGPLPVTAGQHTNTATVTAEYNGTLVTDSDTANYLGGSTNLPITIIIEGPVQEININIITIYDIDIEVDLGNPILEVIRIGDFIRIDGGTEIRDGVVVIIAIDIVIVDIDIVINPDTGIIWRDPGDCSNAPPPWAPAEGWRRRCGGDNVIIIVDDDDDDGMGMGMGDDGMGMGD